MSIVKKSIVKEVQDFYFKKAKKEGYPARSVYKLEEAHVRFRILNKGDKVLDLGCQPGSWSIYAAKIIGPKGLVVGVDITAGKKIYRTGVAEIRTICGDIMSDDIVSVVTAHAPEYQAVISDIAPLTTGNKWADQQKSLTLSRRCLEIARLVLCRDGNFYCKVFEGEDFKDFVDETRAFFSKVKVVKPKSSRKESREVFVLGLNYIK